MSEQGINDGGPAYPHDQNSGQWCQGMTLRQWYAGQALAGLMASFAGTDCVFPKPKDLARDSFVQADAMIAHEQKERDHE